MTAKQALGIDIGGTHTKMGLVDQSGQVQAFRKMSTDAHGDEPDRFLQRLYQNIDTILAEADSAITGIGLSMHGELDSERRGTVLGLNTPALIGVDMRGKLNERYRLPVIINNDLMAHTLGEYYFGTGRGVERFMCVAIGTGLGAAVVVDGKPLLIDGGNSGNTGLVILDPEGPPDSNGIRGSAEALCGVAGIERLAQQHYGRSVTAHEVIAAAAQGDDPIARSIMIQIGHYLGQTLATLSVIFYPHRIALTGGTTAAGPVLLDACHERFDLLAGDFFRTIESLPWSHYQLPEIVLGESGSESGIQGASVELLGLFAGEQTS